MLTGDCHRLSDVVALRYLWQEGPTIRFDFSHRADLIEHPELMDQPCSYAELRGCLRSIASVNRLTFAYRPTLDFLSQLDGLMLRRSQPIHIVDVGCGYGDMLRRIYTWAKRRRVPVVLTGIDLNADAVRAAREATRPGTVTFLSGDAFEFRPLEGIDVIVSSLLMHHLEDAEIVRFVEWMEGTARLGWFINDLHRQPTPYRLFRVLSRFTTWHRFAKHDGPVSILRSFREADWRRLCATAGLAEEAYRLRTFAPARLCVMRWRTAGAI